MNVLERQIKRARETFQPLFATLEVTQSCNYSCKHCYNFDRSLPPPSPKSILTFKEIQTILAELSKLGSLSLNITGGEPLLRQDIFEILEEANKYPFQLRLKTNGFLLNEKTAKLLSKKGVKEVDISLYGPDEETYLKFCDKEGFRKTIRGIENAKAAGIKVNVSIILHKENYKSLDQMIELLTKMEVFFNISDEITDRYDKSKAREEFGLSQEDYEVLLKGKNKYFFDHDNSEKSLMCGCAKVVIGIGAFGDVFPCIGAPIPSGNIREERLDVIWKSSKELNKIRNYSLEDFKECSTCDLIESCSRSSGSAFINTGEYTACDPVALEHAKARVNLKK